VTTLLNSVGFGLITASIIALAAVAFSLQFSVTTTPNFAHGELLTVGAYGAYAAQQATHSVAVEVVAALVSGAITACVLNLGLVEPFLRAGAKRLTVFLVTVAFSWIVQNVILFFYGGRSTVLNLPTGNLHHVGPFLWSTLDEAILASAIALLTTLHVVMKYTKFGKSLRAVSDNASLARVTGINYPAVVRFTWAADGAIAGFAGFVLAAYVGTLTSTLGFNFLVVVFAAAVLGGLGKPYGTMLGALVIGVAMEVSAAYIPAEYKTPVAFGLLIVVLLFRPQGLFSTQVWNMAE
jgi:branched-subunit amino acid ABC-type transport system permease component